MKTVKIVYWVSTIFLGLMMAFSAFSYLTSPDMTKAFHHLGFPDYFRIELAYAKFIGVVFLLAPLARRYKEWAYAGFAIVFISAIIAHTASGDPIGNRIGPVIGMIVLIISYVTYHHWIEASPSTRMEAGAPTARL